MALTPADMFRPWRTDWLKIRFDYFDDGGNKIKSVEVSVKKIEFDDTSGSVTIYTETTEVPGATAKAHVTARVHSGYCNTDIVTLGEIDFSHLAGKTGSIKLVIAPVGGSQASRA